MAKIPRQTPDDDTALLTIRLRDCFYDFKDLIISPELYPNISAIKTRLVELANHHYNDYEIVGRTEYDFLNMLQSAFNIKADTLEKYLMIYSEILPDLNAGDEITEYDTNLNNNVANRTDEMPLNVPISQPTSLGDGTSNTKQTGTVTIKNKNRFGRGIEPTQDRINRFLNEHQTIEKVFIDMFRDCFITIGVIV